MKSYGRSFLDRWSRKGLAACLTRRRPRRSLGRVQPQDQVAHLGAQADLILGGEMIQLPDFGQCGFLPERVAIRGARAGAASPASGAGAGPECGGCADGAGAELSGATVGGAFCSTTFDFSGACDTSGFADSARSDRRDGAGPACAAGCSDFAAISTGPAAGAEIVLAMAWPRRSDSR